MANSTLARGSRLNVSSALMIRGLSALTADAPAAAAGLAATFGGGRTDGGTVSRAVVGSRWAGGPRGAGRRLPVATAQLVANLLELLQDTLELVLGAGQLTGQAYDIAPAGDAQVAHNQIHGVVAELGQCGGVLGQLTEQRGKPTRADEPLTGLGRL